MTTPSHIGTALREQLLGGRLWRDIGVSAEAFVVGLGLAVVVGIPIGLVMGWRRRAAFALDPLLTALYASPLIALAPLIIITAGVGLGARALLVFLLAVFPFVFNTFAGVRCTDPLLVNVVRSFGGTDRDLYVPGRGRRRTPRRSRRCRARAGRREAARAAPCRCATAWS